MARWLGPLLFTWVLGMAVVAEAAGGSGSATVLSNSRAASNGVAAGVVATVTTDGALVLVKPDLDASPIAQLEAGKKIRVSKGTTAGEVKFRKVRVGNRVGFIADIDIRIGDSPEVAPDEGATKKSADQHAKKVRRKKDASHRKKHRDRENDPMYFSRFVGLIVGVSEFKEGIDGVDSSTSMPFYGLKITGPDVLLNGPIMDFDLLLHYGAPSYYDALSATKPSGFVILTDALLHVALAQGQNGLASFGIGPMLMLSQFTVTNAGRNQSLTELNLGLSLSLGASYRIEKVAIGIEGKYFIEKHSYRGLFATLQSQF